MNPPFDSYATDLQYDREQDIKDKCMNWTPELEAEFREDTACILIFRTLAGLERDKYLWFLGRSRVEAARMEEREKMSAAVQQILHRVPGYHEGNFIY